MIAALYVATGGIYFGRPDVDPWDATRDARTYAGPWPVVAHPPCQLWTNFACVNYTRYGGAHNRPGNDGGRFVRALAALVRFGGVLEHPAGSHAWETFDLQKPQRGSWQKSADCWVTEVSQSAYGHRARKRTWLLYCGEAPPPALDWSDPKGTHQVGWFDRNKPTLGKKAASATPPAFAELLISIAKNARPAREEAA